MCTNSHLLKAAKGRAWTHSAWMLLRFNVLVTVTTDCLPTLWRATEFLSCYICTFHSLCFVSVDQPMFEQQALLSIGFSVLPTQKGSESHAFADINPEDWYQFGEDSMRVAPGVGIRKKKQMPSNFENICFRGGLAQMLPLAADKMVLAQVSLAQMTPNVVC